jgi:hypothetical protein
LTSNASLDTVFVLLEDLTPNEDTRLSHLTPANIAKALVNSLNNPDNVAFNMRLLDAMARDLRAAPGQSGALETMGKRLQNLPADMSLAIFGGDEATAQTGLIKSLLDQYNVYSEQIHALLGIENQPAAQGLIRDPQNREALGRLFQTMQGDAVPLLQTIATHMGGETPNIAGLLSSEAFKKALTEHHEAVRAFISDLNPASLGEGNAANFEAFQDFLNGQGDDGRSHAEIIAEMAGRGQLALLGDILGPAMDASGGFDQSKLTAKTVSTAQAEAFYRSIQALDVA